MFAFTKTQRLLKKVEYDHVFEHAKKVVTAEFIVFYKANELGYPRLGLAISKKMVAKAHERNRIKRLLRERFRQTHLPAVDIVFLARHGVAKETNSDINTRLSKTWERIISGYAK